MPFCFLFLRNNRCKNAGFLNQPWRQMRALLIPLFRKKQKLICSERTPLMENERETSELKYGAMFFYEVEGHMQKLSSFGRVKKIPPKKSLTSRLLIQTPLQLLQNSPILLHRMVMFIKKCSSTFCLLSEAFEMDSTQQSSNKCKINY